MSDATATRTAAQHLASVWKDGKRRVVVAQPTVIRHNGQTISKSPAEVIDDPHTIALLEEHKVDIIDLEVNGRPKRGQWLQADLDISKNIDAVAAALGIAPNLLHDAIENGKNIVDVGTFHQAVIADGLAMIQRQAPVEAYTIDDAIALVRATKDPSAEALADLSTMILDQIRAGKSTAEEFVTSFAEFKAEVADELAASPALGADTSGATGDHGPEWNPGDGE